LHPPPYSKNFRFASALIFASYKKKQNQIGNVLCHVPFPSVMEPEPVLQEPELFVLAEPKTESECITVPVPDLVPEPELDPDPT
jgi:hypothetical protein